MAMDMSKEMRAVHPIAIGLIVLSYHHVFEEMRLSAAAMYRDLTVEVVASEVQIIELDQVPNPRRYGPRHAAIVER
uniref:Uncharacterized protein n=2 Tax=Oryza TaxID=4527 RepID=A0A0D3EJX2_9ORYZ